MPQGLLSGVLPAVYSASDRFKRGLLDLLQNPGASMEQTAGGLMDSRNKFNELNTKAFANPQRPMQITDPQALAQQTEMMMAGPLGFAPAGITAWHGSPHKFDKFDSSKIGTGEGAQAYGHGLYLAEAPGVAKEYAKLDPAGGQIPSALRFINGQEVKPGTGAYKAASLLDSMTLPQARKLVSGWLKDARPQEAAYFKEVSDTLASIPGKSAVKQAKPGGNLYKVDLPDEHVAKMLDWDKPLSQQPKEVQTFAKQALSQEISNAGKVADGWGDLSAPYDAFNELTGRDLVSKLRPNLNVSLQNITGGGGPEVSSALRNAGIPGIRYLDGGSRGTGTGTSNFVVFPGNEGLLTILERNGQKLR